MVWVGSAEVFVVGGSGVILRYDGSNWNPMISGTTERLYGIWGDSNSGAYAVGEKGTILHYDGSTWSAINSGTAERLNSIGGISSAEIFVVGGGGTILHYVGSAEAAEHEGGGVPLWGWVLVGLAGAFAAGAVALALGYKLSR